MRIFHNLAILFATVLLCSCSENTIHDTIENVDKSMNFISYNSSSTSSRAVDVTNADLQTNGFYAMSRRTAGPVALYGETQFAFSGGFYAPVGSKWYWPATGTVDFFAYNGFLQSEGITAAANFNTGNPTFAYTTTADASTQNDVIVAFSAGNSYDGTINNGHIPLVFKHALSKITCQVMANTTNTALQLKITEITLKSVNTTGDCVVNETNTSVCTWSGQTTPADMSFSLLSTMGDGSLLGAAVPAYVDVADSHNGAFMVVPQQLTQIFIKYHWEESGVVVEDCTAGKTIDISSAMPLMVANSHYTLQLNIPTQAKEITFTATVDGWNDGGDQTFNAN